MATIEELDSEISDLHARISQAKAQRNNVASVLLSQPHLATRLGQPKNNSSTTTAIRAIEMQKKRNLENSYRACAGVTAYKVQDPDPNAANNGNILGLSIDVAVGGRFADTYHVLLTWSEQDGNRLLRIHKHTIPPCIPVQQLARKWLATTSEDPDVIPEQDLVKFGRQLRSELVSWRMRVQATEGLKQEAGLEKSVVREDANTSFDNSGKILNAFVEDDDSSSEVDEEDVDDGPARLIDIEADTAVREITLTWTDRRTAILRVSKDGRIEKAICRTKAGVRDDSLSRKAMGPITGLLRRINA